MGTMVAVLISLTMRAPGDTEGRPADPEIRAVAYLAREVPRWRPENDCRSCHHDGDGARALYRAIGLGFDVPSAAIRGSTDWLARPIDWDDNGGDGPFNDRRLARIQFSWALAGAVEAGVVPDRAPLIEAANRLDADQGDDGSWRIDGPDAIGSPATYGRSLATLAARRVLGAADPARHRRAIMAADAWLDARPITTIMDASVELLRGPGIDADRRLRALDLLRRSQAAGGGWGPYAASPPEVFDTALAVLALLTNPSDETDAMARRGRAFLVAEQLPSGGWIETTRPSGGESFAQHLSTSAWAALALMESRTDSR